MKIYRISTIVLCFALAACQSPATESEPPTPTQEVSEATLSPTETPVPSETPTPAPTSIPGSQVIPIESMADAIPWLPLDESARPMTIFIGINNNLPPFDIKEVRQAFAAATDRQVIADLANRLNFENVSPATQFTPAAVLGQSMYGEVGIGYDPELGRELLAQAGYTDMSTFPEITMVVPLRGAGAPGFYVQAATALAEMWSENLGVSLQVIDYGTIASMLTRLREDPVHLYLLGWGADINDPDNFLNGLLRTGGQYNFGGFSSTEFDNLINQAISGIPAVERQLLYIEAEQIVTQYEAGVIPLIHANFYRVE